MYFPRFKICCIRSIEEAALAVQAGASAVGLVSAMPSGPGVIEDNEIRKIARALPPGVSSFLLTSKQSAEAIVAQVNHTGTTAVQIVDRLLTGTHGQIRERVPWIKIVQVIHVLGPDAVDEAVRIAPHVDAILLDSGNPNLSTKELGGTGRRHNWEISRRIRETVAVPVYLAGGLNARNVREAIDTVAPFAVDVCSGVRTNGLLDRKKLFDFVDAVSASRR